VASGVKSYPVPQTELKTLTIRADDAAIKQLDAALWTKATSNGTDHYRLHPDAIDDIGIVCSFTVK